MAAGNCLKDGLIAGTVAGLAGGLPSTLALSIADLDQSIQAVAHLVPGNSRFRSAWSRRALGAVTHMALSASFGLLYACVVRRRGRRPSLRAAAGCGAVLWAVNYKLLGPKALKAQDRSLALPDHLGWAVAVELSLRLLAARRANTDKG